MRGSALSRYWIDETYRVDSMTRDLGLELADEYRAIRECVGRDTRRMSTADAVRYCDNVFKVHCPGLDLLTEIGEAQVGWCEEQLAESLGADPRLAKSWKTCAQHKVFDRYSMQGKASDAAACKAALDACGTEVGAAAGPLPGHRDAGAAGRPRRNAAPGADRVDGADDRRPDALCA